jgi:hypothetical protein
VAGLGVSAAAPRPAAHPPSLRTRPPQLELQVRQVLDGVERLDIRDSLGETLGLRQSECPSVTEGIQDMGCPLMKQRSQNSESESASEDSESVTHHALLAGQAASGWRPLAEGVFRVQVEGTADGA